MHPLRKVDSRLDGTVSRLILDGGGFVRDRGGEGDRRGLRRGCILGGLDISEDGVVAEVVESPDIVTSVVFHLCSRGDFSS